MDLAHHVLKADLAGAQAVLGVSIEREDREEVGVGSLIRERTLHVKLPKPCGVRARFVREGCSSAPKSCFARK
jgi:hypothetical protein